MSQQAVEVKEPVPTPSPEELTAYNVFPAIVGLPKHYADWYIDRTQENRVETLEQRLQQKAQVADNASVQMQENVDANVIPSALEEWKTLRQHVHHAIETGVFANAVMGIWIDEKLLAWTPHQRYTRKLWLARLALEIAHDLYDVERTVFKKIWFRQYVDRYGQETAREKMVKERGPLAERAYDDLRSFFWFAENMIQGALDASRHYVEGGGAGLVAFDKRSREITDERGRRETLTIERATT